MKKIISLIFFLFMLSGFFMAQSRNLKLKGKVELRNWQFSSKAYKNESFLTGASIKLYKANAEIAAAVSDAHGNFEIDIPDNGQYILMIEYPGKESKKFAVNAKSVSPNKDDANFKPNVDIVGIVMSKPKSGKESIGLNMPSATIVHKTESDNKQNSRLRTNIYDGEYKLIQKFCTANKLGDMALERKDYSLAKTFYLMAVDMIDGEEYPKTQLKKAEEGIQIEKATVRKKQRHKQGKVKSAMTNKKPASSSTKTSSSKNTVETGKATRKTPKPLGGK